MNRRELVQGLGVAGLAAVTPRLYRQSSSAPRGAEESRSVPQPAALPQMVAGVRLIDSAIARKAIELSRASCPPYLFNHTIRTFIFGSLTGRALGQRFDEEVLFLACVLHDLGLTERFQGDLAFELQGAEAARHFLEENTYSKEGAETVWDGIAMHASAIGQFKKPEIALVGEGAGADVLGPDFAKIKKSDVDEILKAFPRLGFKTAFVTTCADIVRKHPRGASRSFMRDIGERHVENFHPRNFCDLIEQAPFSE